MTDDPFLLWLSQLSGPLSPHQSRLVLGALLDLFRHAPPEARQLWHQAFHKWWTPPRTILKVDPDFESIMEGVRQPPRRGRPARSNELRVQYIGLLYLAEGLASRPPSLAVFRKHVAAWQGAGLVPVSAKARPLLVPSLYRDLLDKGPKRMVLALLHAATGKSVKAIQRKINDTPPTPSSAP